MSLCVTECDLKTFVCWAEQRLPAVWSSDGLILRWTKPWLGVSIRTFAVLTRLRSIAPFFPLSCNQKSFILLLKSSFCYYPSRAMQTIMTCCYRATANIHRFTEWYCSNFSPVCFTLLHLESPRSVVQKYNNTHGKRTVVVGRCQRSWWKCETATQNHLCLIQPERQLDRDEPPSVCAVVRQIIVTASKLWFVWNYEMANVKSINQITAPKGDNNDSLNI